MLEKPIQVRAVVIRQGEWWTAQCLEYDIAVQARHIGDLDKEIVRVFAGHISLALKEKREPLADIPKAPEKFWKLFEKSPAQLKFADSRGEPKSAAAERKTPKRPKLDLRVADLAPA